MPLELTIDVNDPDQSGLLQDFLQAGKAFGDQQLIRNDKNLDLAIRPVVASGLTAQPWNDDWLNTDTFQVAIGNPDQVPTSGTFDLSLDGHTSGLSGLALSITDADLTTALSAASVAGGHPTCTVVSLTGGQPYTWQVTWSATGAVPAITSPSNALEPQSQVNVVVESDGTSTPAVQILTLRESPVAYAQPSTAFPSASVSASVFQAGDSTHDKIYSIALTDGTYGGAFSINIGVPRIASIVSNSVANPTVITTATAHGLNNGDSVTIAGVVGSTPDINGTQTATVIDATSFSVPVNVTVAGVGGTVTSNYNVTQTAGLASPGMTADEFLALLENHPLIQSDNVIVTAGPNSYTVEFTGIFGLSNSPTLAVTNVNLVAPLGVSGSISLNTIPLCRAFWGTTADSLTYTLAVRRARASGEDREILQFPITLKRNIIDVATLVPVSGPTYLRDVNNLSDVASISSSRTNLGLGTADSPTFAGLSNATPTQIIDLAGSALLGAWTPGNLNVVTNSSATITLTPSDSEILVYLTNSGARTVTLPAAPSNGSVVTLIDAAGNASTNAVTVVAGGSDVLADSYTSFAIDRNFQSLRVVYRSGVWIKLYGASGIQKQYSTTATSLTTATLASLGSISLTPGIWELYGMVEFSMTGATATEFQAGFSSSNSSFATYISPVVPMATTALTDNYDMLILPVSVTVGASATVYINAKATFSAGTMTGSPLIKYRRIA